MTIRGQIMGSRVGGVRLAPVIGLVTGLTLVMSGCSAGASGSGASPDKPKVGIILPTGDTAPRWESADGTLERFMRTEGLDPGVVNVADNANQLITTADKMIADGATVLVVASPDVTLEAEVVAEARKHGVPTIDYDLRGVSSP